MSKNLTRKGLALGALIALGSSVIAGAPAQAAGELNVVPSAGTSYNAVAGTVFNLATTLAPGYTPSSYAQLKYIIKTDANSAIHYGAGTSAVAAPSSTQAVSLTSSAVTATSASATTVNYLGLKADTASVTSSIEVTAFVDANNDGAVTAGEWNTVRTVTFKKLADITPVVTLTQPSTGDTTVSATVAWGDLNVQQASNTSTYLVAADSTNSALAVEFNVAAAGYPAGDLATDGASGVTYSSTTGKYSKTVTALASGATVAARAVWSTNTFDATPDPDTNTYSSTLLGSAVSGAATARTINTTNGLVANVLKGNDAVATAATAIATTTAATVRTNGTFTAQVKAYDTTAGTALAAPSVAVVGSVYATTTTTDLRPASTGVTEISVTVNGTKYTSETALNAATVALTTDATGLASLVISSVGLSANDVLTVSFKAQNITASVVATQTAATYTVTDDNASTVVATNKNTATTFNYSVKDQFGVLSARTNERLLVTATTAATVYQFITVSGGKASFTVTPVTDSTSDITVAAALQVSTTNTTTGVTTWAGNGTDVADHTLRFRSAAYAFDVAPTVAYVWNGSASAAYNSTSNYKQALTTAALADLAAVSGTTAANATWQTVTLTGSNAGEKLTVSGTSVFLSIDGATVTENTASKVAAAAAVTIYVASNTTGAKTLTVTNGTVSKTVVVTFDKAGSTAGKTVSMTAMDSQAQAGRAVDVSAVIVDKFGNPVQGATVTLASTGVGYLANVVTTSDAAGKVTAKLIVGSADLGTATITATSTDA